MEGGWESGSWGIKLGRGESKTKALICEQRSDSDSTPRRCKASMGDVQRVGGSVDEEWKVGGR